VNLGHQDATWSYVLGVSYADMGEAVSAELAEWLNYETSVLYYYFQDGGSCRSRIFRRLQKGGLL